MQNWSISEVRREWRSLRGEMTGPYYVGVDVGTSSVRAALVTGAGHLITTATQAITIWEPQPHFYEQSSDEIWQAVCTCVRVS